MNKEDLMKIIEVEETNNRYGGSECDNCGTMFGLSDWDKIREAINEFAKRGLRE